MTDAVEDAVYNFICSFFEDNKYCSNVMKKHLNKELVITKEDHEDFENSPNVGSVIMIILILMLK